tara:strand:- start:157 stop:1266 length:1110 start_codon:yes stop_codon:yes gene_type:complete
MENSQQVRFKKPVSNSFDKVLKLRVAQYFENNKLSKFGNFSLYLKTIIMFSLYLTPFFLMLFHTVTGFWPMTLMYLIMGVGITGIGTGFMHDANHGAFSKSPLINKIIGYSINFVGGSAVHWKIQHNVLHHSYTNIHGKDEDINPPIDIIRISPHNKLKPIHKYQFLYAWLLYGIMTFTWITIKEFMQLNRWEKKGYLKAQGRTYWGLFMEIFVWKIFYFAYMVYVPLVYFPVSGLQLLFYILIMHLVAGVSLGAIFQAAHVVPGTSFPIPDKEGMLEDTFAIHQLRTTADFAQNNPFVNWFVGGLNFQIEHHLFPNVSHVHYKALSKIVKQTAEEFDLPYMVQPTFRKAVSNHIKILWDYGRIEQPSF